jgi:hypothetical protein
MIYRFSIPLKNQDEVKKIIINFKNSSKELNNKLNYFNKKNYLKVSVKNNKLIILSKELVKNIDIIY